MALPPPSNPKVGDYPIKEESLVIVDMLDRLLEAVVGLYEQQGVPLPTRRYWMMGPAPAEDCPQVVVCFMQSYLGTPGDQASVPQQCNQPRTAVLNIYITRNHPEGEVGKAVPAERIIEASKWPAVDTAVLMWGLEELNQLADFMGGGPGVIATVNVAEPSGGVQTTVLNLSRVIG